MIICYVCTGKKQQQQKKTRFEYTAALFGTFLSGVTSSVQLFGDHRPGVRWVALYPSLEASRKEKEAIE